MTINSNLLTVPKAFARRPTLLICLMTATSILAGFAQDTSAPTAKKVPKVFEEHGQKRTDPYYWLKDRENPAVIDYLKQENDYLNRSMAHTTNLQTTLFDEIVGRIKKDDDTVPVRIKDYYYYTRFVEGGEYAIHCRKKGKLDAPEEIFLNENELAKGHDFFSFAGWDIHPGQKMAAFAVDTVGRRFYTIRFKNLESGEFLPQSITNVTENFVWAEDGKTLLYSFGVRGERRDVFLRGGSQQIAEVSLRCLLSFAKHGVPHDECRQAGLGTEAHSSARTGTHLLSGTSRR